MWWWRERIGAVELGFTDRFGGVSAGIFAELNLSINTADDPAAVLKNQQRFKSDFDCDLITTMKQVHGSEFTAVETPGEFTCDGLITTTQNLGLLAMGADCVPLLLFAGRKAGAFHIGRKGLVAGLTENAIAEFSGEAEPTAVIGPYACGNCYELPIDLADEITSAYPAARSTTTKGTTGVDIGNAIRSLLTANNFTIVETPSDFCTIENDRFFSHRSPGRNGGRQTGVVMIRDA